MKLEASRCLGCGGYYRGREIQQHAAHAKYRKVKKCLRGFVEVVLSDEY